MSRRGAGAREWGCGGAAMPIVECDVACTAAADSCHRFKQLQYRQVDGCLQHTVFFLSQILQGIVCSADRFPAARCCQEQLAGHEEPGHGAAQDVLPPGELVTKKLKEGRHNKYV